MIDGAAMRPTTTLRIPHDMATDMEVSRRAQEACRFFGAPYAAVVLSLYGPEIRRLSPYRAARHAPLPIGCLNQEWSGPLLVWYPEGDWLTCNSRNEEK